MNPITTGAKLLFIVGIFLGITGMLTVAGGGATPLGLLLIVGVMVAPHLYLQFAAGKEPNEQTAA